MKRVLLSFTLILISSFLWATSPFTISRILVWDEIAENINTPLSFDGAIYIGDHPSLPMVSERFPLDAAGKITRDTEKRGLCCLE